MRGFRDAVNVPDIRPRLVWNYGWCDRCKRRWILKKTNMEFGRPAIPVCDLCGKRAKIETERDD